MARRQGLKFSRDEFSVLVPEQPRTPAPGKLTRHQSIHVFLHPIFKFIGPRGGGFYAQFALWYRVGWRLALPWRFARSRFEFEGKSWGRRV
ncbi:MAG: hypothetical protein QOK23_2591 [Gammaproteobacteria bacterium]|jgi:hypothetical protein|nr:hypothetical protein [Gammaproteobacteria bacterium]